MAADLLPGMGGDPSSPFVYLPAYATEARCSFVRVSVKRRAGKFPFVGVRPEAMWALVWRKYVAGSRGIVIATRSDPDAFVACFIVRPGLVVHAYTKEEYQRQGLMSAALRDFGFTFEEPTAVLVWSAVASRIAAKGKYHIYPEVP